MSLSFDKMPYEEEFFEKTFKKAFDKVMYKFENYSKTYLKLNDMLKFNNEFKQ